MARPSPPRYEDFVVHWSCLGEGTFSTQVVRSPEGEAESRFEIPVTRQDLAMLAEGFSATVEAAGRQGRATDGWSRHVAALGNGSSGQWTPRTLGEALFRALFSGPVGERFFQSLGSVGRAPLRLKLQLNLESPELAFLHSIPWEYLFRPDTQSYLATGPRFSVVRYPSLPFSGNLPPMPSKLRILLAVAAPEGPPPLRLLVEEAHAIERHWKWHRRVQVECLPRLTLDRLVERLSARDFHVLHFMGHGDLDSAKRGGVLLFEGEDGSPQAVEGSELKVQLAPFESLRLIVLNACQTARTATTGAAAGVATALLQGGFAAVVANQLPITDQAARAFSDGFYEALARDGQVDAAVASGRRTIRRRCPGSVEWGIPVLFLRAPDGELFDREGRVPRFGRRQLRWAWACLAILVLIAAVGIWQQRRARDPVSSLDAPETVETTADDPEPGSDLPPVPGPVEVKDGQAARLPKAKATVAVRFGTAFGENLVTLTIEPLGRPSFRRAISGPDFITFDAQGPSGLERQSLTVLDVDWRARKVTFSGL